MRFASLELLKSRQQPAQRPDANARPIVMRWRLISNTIDGGGERDRTDDLLLAKQALSQLSYTPSSSLVGLVGLEPTTPALSRRCSNQLSYRPLACLLTADKRERFSTSLQNV